MALVAPGPAVTVFPPGDALTVYWNTALPPSELGAFQVTVAPPSPAVAATARGADGGLGGTVQSTVAVADRLPLWAVTDDVPACDEVKAKSATPPAVATCDTVGAPLPGPETVNDTTVPSVTAAPDGSVTVAARCWETPTFTVEWAGLRVSWPVGAGPQVVDRVLEVTSPPGRLTAATTLVVPVRGEVKLTEA